MTEDEMVGWHHQFIGHELGQTPRDGERQGALVCCSPWSYKELDMAWQLNTHTHAHTHTHTHTHTDLQTNKHHMDDLFSTRTLLNFYSKR